MSFGADGSDTLPEGREPGYDQRGFGRRESNVNGFTNIWGFFGLELQRL